MNGPLSVVTIVAALLCAAWFLLRSALNRAPSRLDLLLGAALSVLVAVLVLVAVVGLVTGDRPADTGTFAGYLLTTLTLTPAALWLAKMEPTRWGSLLLGIGALVIPVLVLRLEQIASVVAGA